jgi:hypothetical protein
MRDVVHFADKKKRLFAIVVSGSREASPVAEGYSTPVILKIRALFAKLKSSTLEALLV